MKHNITIAETTGSEIETENKEREIYKWKKNLPKQTGKEIKNWRRNENVCHVRVKTRKLLAAKLPKSLKRNKNCRQKCTEKFKPPQNDAHCMIWTEINGKRCSIETASAIHLWIKNLPEVLMYLTIYYTRAQDKTEISTQHHFYCT